MISYAVLYAPYERAGWHKNMVGITYIIIHIMYYLEGTTKSHENGVLQ